MLELRTPRKPIVVSSVRVVGSLNRVPLELLADRALGGPFDALTRVKRVPPIDNLKSSLQLLISVRNGVVHAGQVETDADVLVPFLRVSEHLRAEMPDADREAFWGDSLEIVDARLAQSTDAAKIRAAEAIAAAKRRFAERYSDMEAALQRAMISTVEDTYAPEKYDQTLWTCPVCEHQALVYGNYDVDWEPDWD
jgi:hypothetical protein